MSIHTDGGYIAVDLDGTLARYEGWNGGSIGEPIMPMVNRVKGWLAAGHTVKIFTARMHGHGMTVDVDGRFVPQDVLTPIQEWCAKHIGQVLEVTNKKDFGMIVLYDDRCVQVVANTGELVGSSKDRKRKPYKKTLASIQPAAGAERTPDHSATGPDESSPS